MFKLFDKQNPSGKVKKNKFWSSLEKIGIILTKSEIDQVFGVFDKESKGYFTF